LLFLRSEVLPSPEQEHNVKYDGEYIQKRTTQLVPFQPSRILSAIKKAFIAHGTPSPAESERLTRLVLVELNAEYQSRLKNATSLSLCDIKPHSVEEIQDRIIQTLLTNDHAGVGLTYVRYRLERAKSREVNAPTLDAIAQVSKYVDDDGWSVRENSNMGYSVQGLNNHISENAVRKYWLEKYPTDVQQAHSRGSMHIHDLGFLGNYCCGWDLRDLLLRGFRGVKYKTSSGPAKHLRTALLQLCNFLYTMQGEAAGAQAVSNFDTLLAPFIAEENLSYREVRQMMQEFIFNLNVPTRVGFQTPFTNITLDLFCPKNLANDATVIGGKLTNHSYGEFQAEIDMLNQAFAEVMLGGDADGRIFSYPIPTYNVSKEWDWNDSRLEWPFSMAAKYGIPYFSNFINSDMNPDDTRSMCCRLRLDNTELLRRGGGLFGANPLTGSIGVVTLSLPLLAYESNGDTDVFFSKIRDAVDLAAKSLELKREILEQHFERGLYPYSAYYLDGIHGRTGKYLGNHFSTIGLVGMHEACLNLQIDGGITSATGQVFAQSVLSLLRAQIQHKQITTGNLYNLEATPAESTCYSLALKARDVAPDILTSGGTTPYFTNSSMLPVDYTTDIFDALSHQDALQTGYTGGTVFHAFLGEKIEDWRTAMALVRSILTKFKLPYLSLTPTFSICPTHGYLSGEHFNCPICEAESEVWSRVTGFYRPVQAYNPGKASEYTSRSEYDLGLCDINFQVPTKDELVA
jgi:ribonucleoside-triphosphate reductase